MQNIPAFSLVYLAVPQDRLSVILYQHVRKWQVLQMIRKESVN